LAGILDKLYRVINELGLGASNRSIRDLEEGGNQQLFSG